MQEKFSLRDKLTCCARAGVGERVLDDRFLHLTRAGPDDKLTAAGFTINQSAEVVRRKVGAGKRGVETERNLDVP